MGSLGESLALNAIQRRDEIEFLKIQTIINAILLTGRNIAAAVTGSESGGSDSLNKSLDALKELMLPQWTEAKNIRAKRARDMLQKEVSGGPLKFKVVGQDKKDKRRR